MTFEYRGSSRLLDPNRRTGRTAALFVCSVLSANLLSAQTSEGENESPNTESPSTAAAADSIDFGVANAKLRTARRELRDLEDEALKTRQSQIERERELVAEERLLERSLKHLEKLVAEREKKKAEIAAKIAEREQRLRTLGERAARVRAAIIEYLSAVGESVASGIEWQKEARLRSLEETKTAVKSESTEPAAALASAARIQSEQEALARSVETGSIKLDIGGETIAVHAFHLGLLAVVYASEDGSVVGFAPAGVPLERARSRDVDADAGAANGYLVAVDILRRRRTPAVVDLVLPALDASPEAEEE